MSQFNTTKTLAFSAIISARRWHSLLTVRRQGRYEQLRQLRFMAHALKTDIASLYQRLLVLQNTHHPGATPLYGRILRIIARGVMTLYQWSLSLSGDPRILVWIPWGFMNHEIKTPLVVVRGYLNLLLHKLNLASEEHHIPLTLDIEVLLKGCALMERRIFQHLSHLYWLIPSRDEERFYTLPPEHVARVIWPCITSDRRTTVTAIFPPHIAQMPNIVHRPDIVYMLSGIALDLVRDFEDEQETQEQERRQLYLSVSEADDGIEMSLTRQDYHLLPATWVLWQENRYYEYLRELGGSLAPLTWDEGYGQGVIVRLPWAPPQQR